MAEITMFTCPPRCDAGGDDSDGGHVFNLDRDFLDCDECGNVWTIEAGKIRSDHDLKKVTCQRCSANRPRHTGGSSFCRCGLSAMDWTLMRPVPPRNETLYTCTGCDYDEAEGGLVDQCDGCKRRSAAEGSLMVKGEWHDVYVTTNDGATRDGCDAGCNGRVYLKEQQ
jgi:hypothetical protein